MEICSRFTGMEGKDGAFLLHTDNADIKICFVTDEIVRVRASFDHELAEESYVLMTTAWEDRMDALFKGERTRVEPFAAEVIEDDSTLTFATGKVTLVVDGSLGASYARRVLDAIVSSYSTIYTEEYVELPLTMNPSSGLLNSGYDKSEAKRS